MIEVEIYSLLDELCHAAMTNAPDPRTKEIAAALHKEIMEEANFDIVRVPKTSIDLSDEEEVKPLSDRFINALYKTQFPYGDDEKGN